MERDAPRPGADRYVQMYVRGCRNQDQFKGNQKRCEKSIERGKKHNSIRKTTRILAEDSIIQRKKENNKKHHHLVESIGQCWFWFLTVWL